MAQIEDDFSDGDFTFNPSWSGDTSAFDVDANFKLWLNAPASADEAHLSLPSTAIDTAQWKFSVVLDFNPSSSNKARVYLVSDQADFEASLNGYYVQIGDTEDEVSLYRQDGTSSTKIIDGVDDLVDENPVELNVIVKRSNTGFWELEADTALSGNFEPQGSTVDMTYLSSAYFGVFCDYTSTRSDKFFFDDFEITGAAYGDTIAPSIETLEVVSSDSLLVSFNEALDSVSASTVTHYSVDQSIGSPFSANWEASEPNEVKLAFATSFELGETNTLTISGVEDTSGNSILSEATPFVFIEFETPLFGSFIINEIFADPSPVVGLPEAEFIEIYNKDSVFYRLDSLRFADAADTVFAFSNTILPPYGHVVLCDQSDTSAFSSYGLVVGIGSFPALNNSSDDLKLFHGNTLIDHVAYTDDWYADPEKASGGYTIELINPENPCTGKSNWRASLSETGGTPGAQNSVFDPTPDAIAPKLNAFDLIDSTHLVFTFNESIDSSSVSSGSFTLSSGLTIDSIGLSQEQLTIGFNAPIVPGHFDTITLTQLGDCAGNSIEDTSLAFGFGAIPKAFDLIINEVYPTPITSSPLPNAEFIEIINRSELLITTEGLDIRDLTSSSSLEPSLIHPGEMIIVCDDDDESSFEGFGRVISVGSMPSLNNTDDVVQISHQGRVIDALSYTEQWHTNGAEEGGWTLERINPNDLCGTVNNWATSTDPNQGTPGDTNSRVLFEPSPELEVASVSFVSDDELSIEFSARIDTLSTYVASFNDQAFDLQATANQTKFSLHSDDPFERGVEYEVVIPEITNCVGSPFSSLSTSIYLHDSNDVVINEILFNPKGNGTDFVELYNASSFEINLQGWSLAYFDSSDSLRFMGLSDTGLILNSDAYLALNEDNENLVLNYPQSTEQTFYETDLPSYPNDEGNVIIYDQFRLEMDRFDYSESFHFALIDDPDGVSLERIRFDLPSNTPENWHSASSANDYATPGYVNSQYYPDEIKENTVSLSAEMISPDNDGYQDVVSIDFKFNEPGYSFSATVYTDKGVLVKQVASNKVIGHEGSFLWDGTDENGEKAKTGIHVVIVEAFNLNNEKERFRMPLVVATKL